MDYTGIESLNSLIHIAYTKDSKSEITPEMTIEALDKIAKKVKVNLSYDIPYTAGYSVDGHIVYIDKHVPKTETVDGKEYPLHKLLIVHETIEKAILDEFGIHYLFAHQIALDMEQKCVEFLGLNWKIEDDIMHKYIKVIDKEHLNNVPKDLDLTPYSDEKDIKKLKEIVGIK